MEFVLLLLGGLWVAVNPEHVFRLMEALTIGLHRFQQQLFGMGWARPDPSPAPPSRRAVIAMRLFGIAIATLAFAGLAGLGR